MKTLAIRSFVIALAVAGFSASSMYSASRPYQRGEGRSSAARHDEHPGSALPIGQHLRNGLSCQKRRKLAN